MWIAIISRLRLTFDFWIPKKYLRMLNRLRKIRPLRLGAIGALLFYLASFSNLSAAVYYVNTLTGFDSNLPGQGSAPATPWKTISYAIALASAGDTIEVAAGTYTENLVFNKNLTLLGPNRNISPNGGSRGAEAILQPPAPFIPPVSIGIENVDSQIEVTGFTLAGTGDYLLWANGSVPGSPTGSVKFTKNIVTGAGRVNDGIVYCNNILEVNLQDNRFANLAANGTSHAVQVIACRVFFAKNNSFNSVNYAAIYAANIDSAVIERNIINSTTAAGVIVLHGNNAENQYTLLIQENNIINAGSMTHGGISITAGNGSKSILISQNRIQNSFYGVHIQSASQSITGKAAIIYNWFSANSGAAINHAGIGTLEAAANWYGSPSGPVSPFNQGVTGTQRILMTNQDTLVRFAPWLAVGTDADPATPGLQLPAGITLAIRSSWPQSGNGLLQRGNTYARTGDILEFRDSVYLNENLRLDKALSLRAGGAFTPRFGNLSVAGAGAPQVALLSNFQVNNVNLSQEQGGSIVTGANVLRVIQNYIEAPLDGKAVIGTTVTSRNVSAFENSFGNIGATFLEIAAPTSNNIQVTRLSGASAVVTINGNSSVAYRWKFEGNIPPEGRPLRLTWPANDDNGVNLNFARLWFRPQGSNTWQPLGRLLTDTIGNPRSVETRITQAGEYTIAPFNCRVAVDLGPDSQVCTNTPFTLQPTASGGTAPYAYVWSPAIGLSGATLEKPIFRSSSLEPRNFVATVTDAIGCQAKDTIRLTMVQGPNAFAGRDTMICRAQTLRLNGRASGGGAASQNDYRFTWRLDTALIAFNNPTPTIIQARSGRYFYELTVTDTNRCPARDSIWVIVNDIAVSATPDTTICAGEAFTLTASASGGLGSIVYEWSPDDGVLTDRNNRITRVEGLTVNTIYTITARDSMGCSATKAVAIAVNRAITVDAGPIREVCANTSILLQANRTGGTGAVRFRWSPDTLLSFANVLRPTFRASAEGEYTYFLTATDSRGCASTDSVKISVYPNPTAFAGNDTAICWGATAVLRGQAQGGSGVYSYQWLPDDGSIADNTQLNAVLVTFPLEMPKTYRFQVTDSRGCRAEATTRLTITDRVRAFAGEDVFICGGEPVFLAARAQNLDRRSLSYRWEPDNGSLDEPTVSDPIVRDVFTTTTYTLTVTADNGCISKDEVAINIRRRPIVSAGPNREFCLGSEATLNGEAIGRNQEQYRYLWEALDAPTQSISQKDILNPIVKLANPGVYNYRFTVTDENGCRTSDEAQVTVNPNPIVDAGADRITCPGNAINLQASARGGTGNYAYRWLPNNATLSNDSVINPSVTLTQLGRYKYFVRVSDSKGCVTEDSVLITVNNPITANAGLNQQICLNETTQLRVTATGGDPASYRYQWLPDNGTLTDITSPTPIARFNQPGAYFFSVTVTDASNCTATSQVSVVVHDSPKVTNNLNFAAFCAGTPIRLDVTTTGGSGGNRYLWSPGIGLSDSTALRPVFSRNDVGAFEYVITATDRRGCIGRDTITITNRQKPLATAGISGRTCRAVQQLSGQASGGTSPYSFKWEARRGGIFQDTSPNPLAIMKRSGIYFYDLRVTDSFGCVSDPATVELVYDSLITVSAGPDKRVGTGCNVILNGSVLGDARNFDFLWYPQAGLNAARNPVPLVTRFDPGTFYYFLEARDRRTGCSAIDSVTVDIINVTPLTVDLGPNIRTCLNQRVELRPNFSGGSGRGQTFSWLPATNLSSAAVARPTFQGSTPGTFTYELTVRDDLGCAASDSITVEVANTPEPSITVTPTNVTCIGGNDGAFIISPRDPNLEYSIDGGVDFRSSNIFASLTAGNYNIVVRYRNGCRTARAIEIKNGTAPEIFTVTNVTENSALIAWLGNSSSAGVTYNLQYRLVGDFEWQEIDGITTNAQQLSGLASNANYEVRLQAVCPGGIVSPWSEIATFRTLTSSGGTPTTCQPPRITNLVAVDPQNAVVFWSAPTGGPAPVCYIISYGLSSQDPADWQHFAAPANRSSFLLTNLLPGQDYLVRLRANCTTCIPDSGNISNWSSSRSFTALSARENVITNDAGLEGTVYPNPSNGAMQLSLNLPQEGNLALSVRDMSGKTLKTWKEEVEAGLSELSLDLTALPAGLYLLHLEKDGAQQAIKILIR